MKNAARCLLFLLVLRPGLAGANPPASTAPGPVSAEDRRLLASRAELELRGNILPFWLKNAPDPTSGAFHGLIDQDMKVYPAAARGALLTSRILWTFSAAYRTYHDPAYLEMARRAYRDLIENFSDKEYGGFFWSITADGRPLDTHKQVYGQVFCIYALAEYHRATAEPAALAQAIEIFRLLEAKAHDPKYGGYFDAFDRQWNRLTRGNVLGRAPKSQNSHIHIMEAYTNLLRVWPDARLRDRQRELLELMMTKIVDPATSHLVLFMQDDWTPTSDEFSYGHDIELSWLLVEAAEVLGDPALVARAKPIALAVARVTLAEGVDKDGAVLNEGDAHGPTNTNKDWWPQAEAAVGFLNAWQISGDPRYFSAAKHSWDFIEARMVDRKNGDWYESLQRDGTPLTRMKSKVSVWKCPYHNSRSCLELIERLRAGDGEASH